MCQIIENLFLEIFEGLSGLEGLTDEEIDNAPPETA